MTGTDGPVLADGPLVDRALLRPVRTVNAFEETVERLLQLVKLGVVAPGERLPAERDLAARFGVSRETLREALRALQAADVVVTRRGRYGGTFVSAAPVAGGVAPGRLPPGMTAAEVEDALVLREVLESGAAAAAASRHLSPTERAHLRDRLAEASTGDVASYRRTDARLHLALAELSGSPSLMAAVAEARMTANALLECIPLLPRNLEHSDRQHAAVVAAVLAGDPEAARREMAEHLEGTAMLLRGFLT